MFGDELFEGDEEGGLDCYTAGDGCGSVNGLLVRAEGLRKWGAHTGLLDFC